MVESNLSIESRIKNILKKKLTPEFLEITNNSAEHAKHSAMENVENPESHFIIKIKSPLFANKTALQRHKLVMGLLDFAFTAGVHAIVVKTISYE